MDLATYVGHANSDPHPTLPQLPLVSLAYHYARTNVTYLTLNIYAPLWKVGMVAGSVTARIHHAQTHLPQQPPPGSPTQTYPHRRLMYTTRQVISCGNHFGFCVFPSEVLCIVLLTNQCWSRQVSRCCC